MTGPFEFSSQPVEVLILLGIGFLFGFILESAGFGDSRKLAGQFYFTDLAVLRVMFTAIITCMVLIFFSSAFGLIDYDLVWVNPSYFPSGIAGGLIMGAGFIIGGFCPGTSLVSLATFKLDALFFVLGAACGMVLFAEQALALAEFMELGSYGRFTLPELFALDAGWVVLGAVLMALAMFAGSTWLMRRVTGKAKETNPVRWALLPAALLILLTLYKGQPDWERKWSRQGAEFQAKLDKRMVQVSSAELALLLDDDFISLRLLDVRDERDFNLFHLEDASRLDAELTLELLHQPQPENQVYLLMGNDESVATEVWKQFVMGGLSNVYLLEDGLNGWLEMHLDTMPEMHRLDHPQADEFAWILPRALGAGWPASRVHGHSAQSTLVEKKVKLDAARKKSGGCG